MGSRHQLFVIARVFGGFRTLAAVHHQSLYSERALQRCLRVINVLQATSNRIPILEELRAARMKKGDFWATSREFQPFPFIATCLTVGCSFDPSEGYQDRVHPLVYNITLDRLDINDGITVIDITDPASPSYCFSFLPGGLRPLDARTYLWRYMRESHDAYVSAEDSDDTWIEQTAAVLHGEDEEVKRQAEKDRIASSERIHEQISQNPLVQGLQAYRLIDDPQMLRSWSQQLPADDPPQAENADGAKALSLRDQAMDQLISNMLKDPDYDPHAAAQAQHFSDFIPRYRSKLLSLAEKAELPQSPSLFSCIKLAFSGETVIDLGAFSDVPAAQLLSEADLDSILGSEPQLKTLYLMEMPQISVQYVARVWAQSGSGITDIYHTELLRRPFLMKSRYSDLMGTVKSPLLADRKNPIKYILWARVLVGEHYGHKIRKLDGVKVDWQRLKPATSVVDQEPTMRSAIYPVNDLLLTPTKLVSALVNYFTLVENDKRGYCTSGGLAATGFALAKSLAMASSHLPADATRIEPLPECMFKASSVSVKVCSLHWPLDFPQLKEGEGAVVIINEHDEIGRMENENQEKSRLAVVFPEPANGSGAYKVESMGSFLERTAATKSAWAETEEMAPLLEYWRQRTGFVESAGEEEVHELLAAMERTMKENRQNLSWPTIRRAWS